MSGNEIWKIWTEEREAIHIKLPLIFHCMLYSHTQSHINVINGNINIGVKANWNMSLCAVHCLLPLFSIKSSTACLSLSLLISCSLVFYVWILSSFSLSPLFSCYLCSMRVWNRNHIALDHRSYFIHELTLRGCNANKYKRTQTNQTAHKRAQVIKV